jgi:hypothetical protein
MILEARSMFRPTRPGGWCGGTLVGVVGRRRFMTAMVGRWWCRSSRPLLS